jgi:hypothetical protein
MAGALGMLALPISAIWQCADGWPRRVMRTYAIAMAASIALAIACYWLSYFKKQVEPFETIMMVCFGIYFIGLIGVGWVANGLMMWRRRR